MKEIKLTQGMVALVDDEDFENINQYKWRARKDNGSANSIYYAIRYRKNENGEWIYTLMHRVILNPPKNFVVDHKDHNGLNNQKSNLRICTYRQNGLNRIVGINNKSGLKGVYFHSEEKKWRSQIFINKKSIHLGYYKTKEEAARAYDNAAKIYFGEFARLNYETPFCLDCTNLQLSATTIRRSLPTACTR